MSRIGAEVVRVDYSSAEAISDTLKHLGVDTVVSALNLHWEACAQAQINLIRASAAMGVKRFIPSEYNIDYKNPEEYSDTTSKLPR